ncbi:MAG: Lin0512 family protein [Pseudomonadota bacterium]
MAKKRLIIEFGMGTSLRRGDYTDAACRAVENALWHNSISLAELFEQPREAMLIDVEIGVQAPERVDTGRVAAVFPYGQVSVRAVEGGLDVPRPDGGTATVIANAAISVSFDLAGDLAGDLGEAAT